MRLSYLTALATVSLAALLSFSSAAQAVQSPLHFTGTLKPQERWKVGIVNPQGSSFCAMVNKFDRHVGLAFALSPDGFGSVAIDLGEKAFEAGKDYGATLTTAGGHADEMSAHATSAQSVVIQIGRNDAFYDTLSKKPELSVKLPALDVSFALNQFSGGYRDLVDCSASLSKDGTKMPAVQVKDVEKEALSPLDREVARLTPAAKSATKVAAAADASKAEAQPERKLLASVMDADKIPEAKDPGSAARRWDAEQADKMTTLRAQEQARQAAYLKQAMAEKDAQIASLKKEQAAKTGEKMAAFKAQKKELDERTANLQQQVAALEQANTAGATLTGSAAASATVAAVAKANIVEKRQELAKVKAESDDKARQVNIDLAKAAMQYQQRLGALETDRADMQKKLAQVSADLTDARKTVAEDKTRMTDLQNKLSQSQRQQQDLQASLDRLKEQNGKTEAALNAREKALSAGTKDAAELAAVQGELKKLRAEHVAAVSALQQKIDRMKAETEQAHSAAAKAAADAAKASADRTAAAARAQSAESALADAQKEISGIRKSLVVVKDPLDPKVKQTQAALEKQTEAAQTAKAQLQAAQAHMDDLQQKLSASQTQLNALQQDAEKNQSETGRQAAAVEKQKQALQQAQADIAALRRQNAQLSNRLARVALDVPTEPVKAKVAAAQKEDAAAKAELAQTRGRIEKLEAQLAQSRQQIEAMSKAQAQQAAAQPAPAAAPVKQSAAESRKDEEALAAARVEIAALREKNANLFESLAATTIAGAEMPAGETVARAGQADKAEATDADKMMQAQAEIMKLKTEKLALQDKLEQQKQIEMAKAHVPAITWDRDVPVKTAPVAAAAPVVVTAQNGLRGYTHSYRETVKDIQVRSAPQPVLQAEPAVAQAGPTAAQALAAANVQPAAGGGAPSLDNPDGSFNAGRAEKFLDRIMSYHHVPGQEKTDVPTPKNPPRVFGGSDDGSAAAAPAPAPVSAPLSAPISAPAPAAQQPSVVAVPVRTSSLQAHTPIPYNGGAEPVKLTDLLHQAGLTGVRFADAAGPNAAHLRQWTSGNLNGMIEQLPAADFDAAVQSYLDRYRQDCAGQLKASVSAVQDVAAGKLQQASVSCPVTGNSYETSFVFLQDDKTFTAILHTGYPSDAARINNIGDNIAYMLGSSGGIDLSGVSVAHTASAPLQRLPLSHSVAQQDLSVAPSAALSVDRAPVRQPLRLNVPPLSGGAGMDRVGTGDEDFKTVVVQ
jgi:hypothetical protein